MVKLQKVSTYYENDCRQQIKTLIILVIRFLFTLLQTTSESFVYRILERAAECFTLTKCRKKLNRYVWLCRKFAVQIMHLPRSFSYLVFLWNLPCLFLLISLKWKKELKGRKGEETEREKGQRNFSSIC